MAGFVNSVALRSQRGCGTSVCKHTMSWKPSKIQPRCSTNVHSDSDKSMKLEFTSFTLPREENEPPNSLKDRIENHIRGLKLGNSRGFVSPVRWAVTRYDEEKNAFTVEATVSYFS
mmetsp:Transcript_14395/g.24781  ORF Transcript_14395/g.24781 Transcript_14395/m.24781 type:complete len:116 (-) Transcript_14395:7-354(-)